MIVGITGGTGCGKTTALKAFEKLGGTVIDCDELYHHLLKTDNQLLQAIDSQFPGVIQCGVLDTKTLGNIVFADSEKLNILNDITHRFVLRAVKEQLHNTDEHFAIDAIALLESGLGDLCDVTVAVTAPASMRLQRIMLRDHITEEYARNRIAAQKNDAFFREKCDHILENNGSQDEFYAKCLAFFKGLGIMKPV